MLFTTAKEHRDFFRKKGSIEFSGLLSDEQVTGLNKNIDKILKERRREKGPDRAAGPYGDYLLGHDLWRESVEIKQIICQKRLGSIASELFEKKPLRLGYDQLFVAASGYPWHEPLLAETSCLRGLLGGAMIALTDAKESAEEETEVLFSAKAGNIIFFRDDLPLPLEQLETRHPQRFLLIAYAADTTVYTYQQTDPHTHSLKRFGYVFGDRLKEALNPLLYK